MSEKEDISASDLVKQGEVPIWNILPSYDLFSSTVNRGFTNEVEPPSYETYSVAESTETSNGDCECGSNYTGSTPATTVASDSSFVANGGSSAPGLTIADENTTFWHETILDNVHKLRHVSDFEQKYSSSVKMEIYFTKDVGEIGKVQELIDPSLHEYKAGDILNGYILIENQSSLEIPFDMFYVLFEGNFMITSQSNVKKIIKVKKFLEMFDFSASWCSQTVNRLITETENSYTCPDLVDPIDGTYLAIPRVKILRPKRRYKRFFTFKIPNKLLDSACNEHIISSHIELPPSLGAPRYENYYNENKVKVSDISFIDSSNSYSIFARFIGRSSIYGVDLTEHPTTNKIINSKGDEYIILNEINNFIRIVPDSIKHSDGELIMKYEQNKILYDNLENRVKEKIRIAKELAEHPDVSQRTLELERNLSSSELLFAKSRQVYRSDSGYDLKELSEYSNYLELKKENFIGISKPIATVKLSTPKVQYCVKYLLPPQFRTSLVDVNNSKSWKLKIPIKFSIMSGNKLLQEKKLPYVKSVKAMLNVLTFKSEKYPIPLEINHEFFINKHDPKEPSTVDAIYSRDLFKRQIVKKFQGLSNELYYNIKKIKQPNFKLDEQLFRDIKGMCDIKEKCIALEIPDIKLQKGDTFVQPNESTFKDIPTIKSDLSEFSKEFTLALDLTSMNLFGSEKEKKFLDEYCLIPDFQSCCMGRMYFFKICFILSNGQFANIQIPISIEK